MDSKSENYRVEQDSSSEEITSWLELHFWMSCSLGLAFVFSRSLWIGLLLFVAIISFGFHFFNSNVISKQDNY
jgi:hypothetical protein